MPSTMSPAHHENWKPKDPWVIWTHRNLDIREDGIVEPAGSNNPHLACRVR